MNSYTSLTDGTSGSASADYYNRKQEQEQFDAQHKLEQQKLELQQQQVQLQKQQQENNQKIMIGGFVLASIVVITVVIYMLARAFKRNNSNPNK